MYYVFLTEEHQDTEEAAFEAEGKMLAFLAKRTGRLLACASLLPRDSGERTQDRARRYGGGLQGEALNSPIRFEPVPTRAAYRVAILGWQIGEISQRTLLRMRLRTILRTWRQSLLKARRELLDPPALLYRSPAIYGLDIETMTAHQAAWRMNEDFRILREKWRAVADAMRPLCARLWIEESQRIRAGLRRGRLPR